MEERVLNKLLGRLEDKTIIEAGHYSYKKGPNELDIFLWGLGVKLYAYAKKHYKNIGLLVLVDDVHGVESNKERKKFEIVKLPKQYLKTLKEHSINESEVIILSQEKIKEKGRGLLRRRKESRTSVPKCRLIVATILREKEKLGYKSAIVLSDELKTDEGRNMLSGTMFSRLLYNTKIKVYQFIFKDKNKYNEYVLTPEDDKKR